MGFQVNIPWNKYGIIVQLSQRLAGVSPQFGKTALQKMVYLLTQVYNVPTGYEHTLYTYGPYSADLTTDVDYVAAFKGVVLKEVARGGYEIVLGENAQTILNESAEFLGIFAEEIDSIVQHFGSFSARELELRSTLIYLAKNQKLARAELCKQLISIKPYFQVAEVDEAIEELSVQCFITFNNTGLS